MRTLTVSLAIEEKEMPDGNMGEFPAPSEMAAQIQDYLADVTKHDNGFTWRLLSLRLNRWGEAAS